MKRAIFLTTAAFIFCALADAQKPRVVTAAQANGVYRAGDNEIRILALGGGKLKVQLDLIYAYKSRFGPSANVGFALGEADILNDVATFSPPGTEDCVITMKFLSGNKLKVTEDGGTGGCGFGHNVYSGGAYRKTKSGKPKFDNPENR